MSGESISERTVMMAVVSWKAATPPTSEISRVCPVVMLGSNPVVEPPPCADTLVSKPSEKNAAKIATLRTGWFHFAGIKTVQKSAP